MDLGISGRRALVAASSLGLGRETARALHEAGCDLVVSGRDGARLAEAVADIGGGTAVVADLTSIEAAEALVEAALSAGLLGEKSLVPILKNQTQKLHDATYFHYPHRSNQKGSPSGAIRKGDYKLIVSFNDNRRELYNLKQDIGEKRNLANEMPELTDKLRNGGIAFRDRAGTVTNTLGNLQHVVGDF